MHNHTVEGVFPHLPRALHVNIVDFQGNLDRTVYFGSIGEPFQENQQDLVDLIDCHVFLSVLLALAPVAEKFVFSLHETGLAEGLKTVRKSNFLDVIGDGKENCVKLFEQDVLFLAYRVQTLVDDSVSTVDEVIHDRFLPFLVFFDRLLQ